MIMLNCVVGLLLRWLNVICCCDFCVWNVVSVVLWFLGWLMCVVFVMFVCGWVGVMMCVISLLLVCYSGIMISMVSMNVVMCS